MKALSALAIGLVCLGIAAVALYYYAVPAKKPFTIEDLRAQVKKQRTQGDSTFQSFDVRKDKWTRTGIYVKNKAILFFSKSLGERQPDIPYLVKIGDKEFKANEPQYSFSSNIELANENSHVPATDHSAFWDVPETQEILLKLPDDVEPSTFMIEIMVSWKK